MFTTDKLCLQLISTEKIFLNGNTGHKIKAHPCPGVTALRIETR